MTGSLSDRAIDSSPGITHLRLQCSQSKLGELYGFYASLLGLPLIENAADTITIAAGSTRITFDAVKTGEPYYHFAFNIPENMLAASKRWLATRCPLIKRPDGGDEYDFRSWNAHSIYFNDPAGNILEFIARHNLKNAREGEFESTDILYASEIAVVVDDVPETVRSAGEQLDLGVFCGSNSAQFAALGTDHRLLIVAKRGRGWNSGHGRTAEVWPVHAVIQGDRPGRLESREHQFEIVAA